ncbi:MAG TPA: branched-chain amino acid ABC transporter permease [Candidatus Binatia bacterium]|nr:branched-chain amino acid ABC transporter permease [Candidatus Binatia bacterium]
MIRGRRALEPVVGFGLLAAAGVAVPLITRDSYHLDVATATLRNLLLTMSLRHVMSTGQLNMALVSFMGVGAYASALLVTRAGWSFWAALPVAPLLAALAAVPVGRVALRVSGPYYFLITFAFLEVLRLVFNNLFVSYLGGPSGLVEIPQPHSLPLTAGAVAFTTKLAQYWLMLVLFLGSAAVLIRLEFSRLGLVNSAIRQGELLAETLGVDVTRYKLGAFVLSAFFAGIAGVFFAHSQQVLHSSDFGLEPMVLLVVFTVIGGAGSVWGPVVGTVVLAVASELLRELHHYEILVYGLVLMVVMLFFPEGIVALPGRLARWLARRRARGTPAVGASVVP